MKNKVIWTVLVLVAVITGALIRHVNIEHMNMARNEGCMDAAKKDANEGNSTTGSYCRMRDEQTKIFGMHF
jgi:hypothetical protein